MPGPTGVPPVKTKAQTTTQRDTVELAGASKLARALENIPVVRADKVTKAKALIEDPSYPNDETLHQVADLLADHLRPRHPAE